MGNSKALEPDLGSEAHPVTGCTVSGGLLNLDVLISSARWRCKLPGRMLLGHLEQLPHANT